MKVPPKKTRDVYGWGAFKVDENRFFTAKSNEQEDVNKLTASASGCKTSYLKNHPEKDFEIRTWTQEQKRGVMIWRTK